VKSAKDLEHKVFAEQVSLLFKQYTPAGLTGNVVSVIMAAVLWNKVPTGLLAAWLIALNVCLIAAHVLVWCYRRRDPDSDTQRWFKYYVVSISLIALSWSALSLFLQFELSPLHQIVVIMMLIGVATSALVLAVPSLVTYFIYLSLPMAFLISQLILRDQLALKSLGLLAVMFLVMMIIAGKNLNRNIVNTIRLRYQNADLAKEVSVLNEYLEQRVAEKTQALGESEERFDLAMRGANDGLWDWNLKNNTVYFSPRWKSMLGYGEKEIGSQPGEWRRRIYKDDLRSVLMRMRDHLDGKTSAYESVHRIHHKDGHYLWVLDRGRAVRDKKGNASRLVGTQVDITEHKNLEEKIKSANLQLKHEIKERKIAQQELAYLAKHDPLTNLPNRILFYEQLEEAIQRAKNEDEFIAVLLVDLDNFKNVNDTLGHPTGDRLLADVANRLNSIGNKNYFLSRFGGDEFNIILENCSDTFVVDAYARQIIDLISQPFHLDDQEIRIGCSIGITLFPEHGNEQDQLVRDADIAMYFAKDQGRNTYSYFTEEMDKEINEKVSLRNMLHGALERNEYGVHYQPQIDIRTGKVTGIEALLRWNHEEFGSVPPDKFVPLLEETGMVTEVGYWVLREACIQNVRLHSKGLKNMKLAVNISPRQFLEASLAESIEAILVETGLDAKYLEIEITENVFMEDFELIQQTLSKLKELGVSITLDDFGTGYSSLAYLKRFPINGVKIDKEFVRDVLVNNDSRELVTAIIAMAKGLNMDSVVAEGVEKDAQLKFLQQTDCSTYQGYLYSEPLPPPALEKILLPSNRLRSV
jgi:diguanylate cyclase (GGDEF)-like protein/PAS domain S-box-containing protein